MKKIVDTFLNIEDKGYMFNNSIIVLDANILLSFYSYKEEHCDEVFSLLRGIEDRLWIPYHTISEFMKNRNKVIQDELNSLDTKNIEILKCFNKKNKQDLYGSIYQSMDSFFKKEYVGEKRYSRMNDLFEKLKVIEASYFEIVDEISEERKGMYEELREEKKRFDNDTILEKLKDIYNGKVGEKYTHNKLVDISREALEKAYYTILPGLSKEDLSKTTNVYGDYINYYSIVDYSKAKSKDIIYITNDSKEDWGYKINGEFEYNPTLYEDFHTRTSKKILIIKFNEFIDSINRYIEDLPELSDDTKKAISRISIDALGDKISMLNDEDFIHLLSILLEESMNEEDMSSFDLVDYHWFLITINSAIEKGYDVEIMHSSSCEYEIYRIINCIIDNNQVNKLKLIMERKKDNCIVELYFDIERVEDARISRGHKYYIYTENEMYRFMVRK